MASKLFIDLETTALGDNAGVIELAAIPVVDGEALPHFHSMVRPHDGCTLDPKAFEITGIDIKEIWNYPDAKDVLNDFIKWIDTHESIFSLSGHNIVFDRNKLFRFFCRYGMYSDFITRFHNADNCTLKRSREIFKGKKDKPSSFGLDVICRYFNIQVAVSHRALADIENTVKLHFELEKLESKKETFEDKLSFMERRQKYLDMKYIQMNPEGDIFITTEATKNPNAMKFILNHLWEMYSENM